MKRARNPQETARIQNAGWAILRAGFLNANAFHISSSLRRARALAACATMLAMLLPGTVFALGEDDAAVDGLPSPSKPSYREKTDQELSALGANWEQLTAPQKRALVREATRRMARERGRKGVLQLRTTRQYGYLRKPDGSTVRVERRTVQVSPVASQRAQLRVRVGPRLPAPAKGAPVQRRVRYGTGFAKRVSSQRGQREVLASESASASAPSSSAVSPLLEKISNGSR